MLEKIKSVMLGHAIADALGVPVEFCDRESLEKNPVTEMRGFGSYNVPAGCWSDDTSMALCALDSLAKGILDYNDIMRNFCKWYYNKEFTPTGVVFDIGGTCFNAISNYFDLGYAVNKCGLADEKSNGNGSLMRIHPFVLYAYYKGVEDDEFIDMISKASSLTHAHQCSVDGCIIYSYILKELLDNPCKVSIYKGLNKAKNKLNSSIPYYHKLYYKDFASTNKKNIKSGGYVVDTLEAAIWCLLTTENYSECVLKAVNLGNDTDTVAAVAGGLAGLLYGFNSIPQNWLNILKKESYIEKLCEKAYYTWRLTDEV